MLTHRTNLLLSPEDFEVVSAEAVKQNTSIGEVIRKAIHKTYAVPSVDEQRKKIFENFQNAVKRANITGITAKEFFEMRKIGQK